MKTRLLTAIALSAVAISTAAQAQDVIIMRKPMLSAKTGSTTPPETPTTPSPTPTPTPVRGEWTMGPGVAISPSCSANAPALRQVWCAAVDGSHLADTSCTGEKPSSTTTVADYSGCSFTWSPGPWSEWSSTCSDQAIRTRSVNCTRSDGQGAADASCPGEKPEAKQSGPSTSGCSYAWQAGEWGAWSSQCSATASRGRAVSCLRSDGTAADDAYCTAGTRPEATEAPGYFGGCSYEWSNSEWSAPAPACGDTVQNRTVTCLRSDGETVADASCDASQRPDASQPATDYSTCTYGWSTTSWSPWSTTCGSASRTRTVTCESSDGRTVSDDQCEGTKPEAQQSAYQTSGCEYSWQTGDFGTPAPACGNTTQTRPVTCIRSDGEPVEDASCDASSRPTATQPATDHSTCSYAWSTTTWSQSSTTCGTSTQTRTVTCQRSDGATVSDDSCATAGQKPVSTQTTYPTSGCSYEWQAGDWGPTVPACGTSYQGRTVSCRRSDGQTVDDSLCQGARPNTTQSVNDYSTCMSSHTWNGVDLYHQVGYAEGTAWTMPVGTGGVVTYGPYQQNIAPGNRTVTYRLRIDQINNPGNVVEIDIVGNYGNIIYANRVITTSEVGSGYVSYTLPYTQPVSSISDVLEFRVSSGGNARVSVASISLN